jgi:hypothetical protein
MYGALWIGAGALAWTASEYFIHRFIGHGSKRKRATSTLELLTPAGLAAEFNAEHLAHHTDPKYFALTGKKVVTAAAAIPTIGAALTPLLGARRAVPFAVGFAAMYGAYEIVHRRLHEHPPKGPYGRWVRRNHLNHHHRSPRNNHGVTSPVFDVLMGTRRPLDRLRIPRAVAPVWLIDPVTNDVRAELAADYEVWSAPTKPARPAASSASEPATREADAG